MKRINYDLLKKTNDKDNFEDGYKAIFKCSLKRKEKAWLDWKNKYDPTGTLTVTVEDLLTAEFHQLVEVYKKFLDLKIPSTKRDKDGNDVKSDQFKNLEKIFNYTSGYDDKIAEFFIKWAEKLEIRSCYYCEMSYVNTYTMLDDTGTTVIKKRQFDLDHFLPKGKCPCVGLSLYNFVPSCQVCNSRIKLDNMPDVEYDDYELISPTSAKADFDNNITVRLRLSPTEKYLLAGRYIYLKAQKPYRQYVDFFRLNERYSFHKSEAERIKKLKDRYPQSNIRKIAKLLGVREKEVEEDIFNLQYLKEKGRCFEKFTRDLLTKSKQKGKMIT